VEKNILPLAGIEPLCDRKLERIHNDGIHKFNFNQIVIRSLKKEHLTSEMRSSYTVRKLSDASRRPGFDVMTAFRL
jgi:hypothetical protein